MSVVSTYHEELLRRCEQLGKQLYFARAALDQLDAGDTVTARNTLEAALKEAVHA